MIWASLLPAIANTRSSSTRAGVGYTWPNLPAAAQLFAVSQQTPNILLAWRIVMSSGIDVSLI
jgi:hypothetical protein